MELLPGVPLELLNKLFRIIREEVSM